MKALTTNNKLIIATAFLVAFLSLYLVAGAQENSVSVTNTTTVESDETTSIESTTEINGSVETPSSLPTRGPADREPRPEERTAPTIQERQQERFEDRENALEVRGKARASTTEQRQETRAENVEQRQTLRLERQTALQDVRQQRVLNLSANISNRMDGAIERIFTIITRVEQRIEKLKAAGADTAAAEVKLRESAQLLAEARTAIANIDNLVYNATTSAEPITAWQNVKGVYKEAGGLIRSSHATLKEVVSLLKASINETRPASNPEVQAQSESSVSASPELSQ
jgi:hypothetical protein